MMAYESDIAAVGPVLELTLDYVEGALRCAGTLDVTTRRHVVEAVEGLLTAEPTVVVVDIGDLNVTDVDGADTLTQIERMVHRAGVALRWRGVDPDHLRDVVPLRHGPWRPQPHQSRRKLGTLGRMVHPSMMPPPA